MNIKTKWNQQIPSRCSCSPKTINPWNQNLKFRVYSFEFRISGIWIVDIEITLKFFHFRYCEFWVCEYGFGGFNVFENRVFSFSVCGFGILRSFNSGIIVYFSFFLVFGIVSSESVNLVLVGLRFGRLVSLSLRFVR